MAEELEGKVAIVTGGNTGIGKAVVLALAEKGASVVIDYVANEQATEDLERKIAGLGEKSVGVEADVSKVDDLQRMIDTAVSTFGRLDVMVNNAGIETRTSILDTTEAQYEKVLAINLKSAFFGTQLAAKQMIAQGGGGRIINMTSVHEDWPMPGNTPYCLSKGGMRMLTRTAGVELAPHNISWSVSGLAPWTRRSTPRPWPTLQRWPSSTAPSRSAAWPSPRRSRRWWRSWRPMGRATSRRRRSSPTAGSCRAAPVSDASILRDLPQDEGAGAPGAALAGETGAPAPSSSPTLGADSRARKMW